MIQHKQYEGSSSYVLHKVTGPYSGHCSAYYNGDGTLKDAEQIIGRWRMISRPVKVGGSMWKYLESVGRSYVGKGAEQYRMDAIGAAGIAVGRTVEK